MATSAPTSNGSRPMVLPNRGVAKVKTVLSGDTVVLLGKATTPNSKPPEVAFTFERIISPRIASKGNNNTDEPGAFPAREWLRNSCVGKNVTFETRRQGGIAGDRVYGLLFLSDPSGKQINLALESVRNGHATPKNLGDSDDKGADAGDGADAEYESQLMSAYQEAKSAGVGIHSASPLVRKITSAGDGFETLTLVEQSKKLCDKGTVKCVIEYIFDGSRYRCQVIDEDLAKSGLQHGTFTLLLAGVACPRYGNPKLNPPTQDEPFCAAARNFVELRLLQRELQITLHGTDKSGICAVGTVHHPRGNIAVELLKNGLAKMSDWSVRMMNPLDIPALRIAENNAKRTNLRIWENYSPPQLSGASEILGTVLEVISGDTLMILPNGVLYDDESRLKKVSLASIRAPRAGNERLGRADEPYAQECKDRLRVMTVGKAVKVSINYERDIPTGQTTEKRQFGTVSVGKREDVGQVLVAEGLASTARHRDDDERSPRYDELVMNEATAKAAKKGIHSDAEYKRGAVNDLTSPQKAKAYSGALMRAGQVKAVVEYVFNGSRFKLFVPSENCYIMFSPGNLRCPQPSPSPGARAPTRPAEPFGDAAKRHARSSLLQRDIQITCDGVTNGGVITGGLFVGQGAQRRDYTIELVGAGLATVDQRKIDYGEAPQALVAAQMAAKNNKVGVWSLAKPEEEAKPKTEAATKKKETVASVKLSEIRSGNHFFYNVVGDEGIKVMEDSMKTFTENNGTNGAPCDAKAGKVVAALFNDGSGKSWYRAKILEKPEGGKAKVLFVDHGNVATVPVAAGLRPLDDSLSTDRVPPVAKEAELAITVVRPLSDDDGIEAARMLQQLAWGKELSMRILCASDGKESVILSESEDSSSSINEQLVSEGLARVAKKDAVNELRYKMVDGNTLVSLAADLQVAQETARKSRSGMWRYGDIGDDDEAER